MRSATDYQSVDGLLHCAGLARAVGATICGIALGNPPVGAGNPAGVQGARPADLVFDGSNSLVAIAWATPDDRGTAHRRQGAHRRRSVRRRVPPPPGPTTRAADRFPGEPQFQAGERRKSRCGRNLIRTVLDRMGPATADSRRSPTGTHTRDSSHRSAGVDQERTRGSAPA